MAARGTAPPALFGGTFDPVHNGHMLAAAAAAERFGVRVLFVPAALPPHKEGRAVAAFEDRVRMLELACEEDRRFSVSRMEAAAEGTGAARSYSILTIERLVAEGWRDPHFLIGADAFAEIRSWHRWQDVVREVTFIVVTRPGAEYTVPDGARVKELTGVNSAVSSSEVRARLAADDLSVPVPGAVLRYIRASGLYQSHLA